MEPDSTCRSSSDNRFHRNWGSTETISGSEITDYTCEVCKTVLPDLSASEILDQALVIKHSVVYLICQICGGICHLHCFLNRPDSGTDDLIEVIALTLYTAEPHYRELIETYQKKLVTTEVH